MEFTQENASVKGLPRWLNSNPPANAKDSRNTGSLPGSGRSLGGGNDNPLQYSCLGNPIGREAQWATVHGVTKSWTQLSMQTHPRLYQTASLNFFISAKSIFSRLGGVFYIQENVICKYKQFYFFLNLDSFYLFFSSGWYGRAFKTMLSKSGESGHPCLVPDQRKFFQFFTVDYDVSCVCHLWPLLCWNIFPLCPLSKEFYHKWMLNFN